MNQQDIQLSFKKVLESALPEVVEAVVKSIHVDEKGVCSVDPSILHTIPSKVESAINAVNTLNDFKQYEQDFEIEDEEGNKILRKVHVVPASAIPCERW